MLAAAFRREDFDLEALELAVRSVALNAGAVALGQFMDQAGAAVSRGTVTCPKCRCAMEGAGQRGKQILTMLGPTRYSRACYRCPQCRRARYPGDEALDLVKTSRSPGVRRQTARLGAKEPFHEVAADLRELAGLDVSRKDAERVAEGVGADIEIQDRRERRALRVAPPPPPETPKTIETLYIEMDGTGVPMTGRETAGRKGKQPDGSAKTREVKLGCVFTQTGVDEQGRPARDPGSTTFTGAIEDAAAFGQRIYAEAVRRGLYQARRVIADGAQWIHNLVSTHFPMATRIIDLYHAKEHVSELCKALFSNEALIQGCRERWWDFLAQGRVEAIIEEASQYLPQHPSANKDARDQLRYLGNNKDRMRYNLYQEQGLFIGSGVVEAACKNLVGKRLKQSAMKWTVRGANSIIALRCNILSNRFTDYWDSRAA